MRFSESLRKNVEFQHTYQLGRSRANRYLVMYVLKNNSDRNRVGIQVSKKVGNSVIRHRVKRLIKESYRLHEEMFNSGLDIVVIARTSAKDADFRKIEGALLHVADLHNIIDKKMDE